MAVSSPGGRAKNGEEGLARLAEHGSEVALILSDVVMPRLGGVEMFQAVRQQSRRIPFILTELVIRWRKKR